MVPAPQQPRACVYPLMSGKVRDKAMPAPPKRWLMRFGHPLSDDGLFMALDFA
jgi:hypothetical protein